MTHWIAIATNRSIITSESEHGWWCLPESAKVGDVVFFYCPVSTNARLQGIFARGVVTAAPSDTHPNNAYCSAYRFGTARLLYCALDIANRYEKRVTATEMKFDGWLAREHFVRKNFQGTTFSISSSGAERLEALIARKLLG